MYGKKVKGAKATVKVAKSPKGKLMTVKVKGKMGKKAC
jgi:hypothetical protein